MMATPASTVEPISSAKVIDSRTAVRLSSSDAVVNAVARAAHRVDQLRLERLVDLGAQPRDVCLDDAGLRVEVEIPDPFQEHRAGDHLALVAHQHLEQPELARLQVDDLSGPPHGAAD